MFWQASLSRPQRDAPLLPAAREAMPVPRSRRRCQPLFRTTPGPQGACHRGKKRRRSVAALCGARPDHVVIHLRRHRSWPPCCCRPNGHWAARPCACRGLYVSATDHPCVSSPAAVSGPIASSRSLSMPDGLVRPGFSGNRRCPRSYASEGPPLGIRPPTTKTGILQPGPRRLQPSYKAAAACSSATAVQAAGQHSARNISVRLLPNFVILFLAQDRRPQGSRCVIGTPICSPMRAQP